jgi:hypothetical protein
LTIWFLAILGVAWIAVFVPAAIRARQTAPLPAAERFRKGMKMIAPSTPPKSRSQGRWVIVPGAQQLARSTAFRRSQARRRRALSILVVSSLVSLPVSVVLRGSAVTASLVVWGALFSYVVILLGTKRQREEQLEKVRPIAHESTEVQPIVFNEPARASGGWRN